MSDTRIMIGEEELPRAWYNILPDLPAPLPPPLHPVTREPVGPGDLAPIFPAGLIEQEMSSEQWIAIPDEVRDIYKLWRPTPMQRAARLERFLRTPARIYFKNESVSPAGSHKPNTAVAQAYYNKREGVKRLATETGAGQWGSALSLACRFFGLECTVYMVKVSFEQKPYRRLLMETWGATVHPSPSARTRSGASVLAADPGSPGSLGIAISEAVEDAATHDDTRYALGSVLNHVVLHQTVIGLEARAQLEKIGVEPDVLIGCVGGGSNFSGFVFPFLAGDMTRSRRIRLVAVEPKACPSLTEGLYRYDHGDAVGLTPLLKMHTLGRDFVPPAIHAGGLRYHGDAPLLCLLRDAGLIEAVAVDQPGVFEAAVTFARTEGIVPAPESAHAIKIAIDEAVRCRETGAKKTICFALSGHGHFDLAGYSDYLDGKMNAAA